MPKKYIDANQIQWHSNWLTSDDARVYAYMDEIDNIPAADVEEVRHGYWIPLENNEFQCSECGNRVASSNPSIDVTRDLHYCWNCGVKMNGNKAKDGE